MIATKECNNCGAEYKVEYDDEQFGTEAEEPSYCCFCGEEIDDYFDEDRMEELDFEDNE
jgi:DNA replicative helicase MCM subunit Mcm2 (Cdc46/Mcm family)